jgi:L-iditol 2-dehydrogenase
MKAALLYGTKDLRVEDVATTGPGPGEALIRIYACGVCPSDVRGYLGVRKRNGTYTPGHEWAGVVEAVGDSDDDSVRLGDRVVADWRGVCGTCHQCRKGVSNYCERMRRSVRGGFAEYGVAPISQLRVLPDNVSYEEASFCEPLACITNAHSYTQIPLGGDVVIVGAGPIGLLHMQVARSRGGRVIVSDPIGARLRTATELGAHDVVDASQCDPVERVNELTDGHGADAVIVAVGGAEPIKQALQMAGVSGWVNLFAGTYPPAEMAIDPNLIHYRQLRVTGSHDYTPHHFTTALRLIQYGMVQVHPLISHRFGLDEIRVAFDTTAERHGLKAMVLPNE